MLQDKYIKYSPEITFEVFQKIWDKLIEDGWVEDYSRSCEESYKGFVSEEYISYRGSAFPKRFSFYPGCVINTISDLEMDITQFLSRKLTEFPKEGCCKTTDPLLIKFLDKKYPFSNPIPQKHFSGIGWSNSSFWYLINTEKSSKPLYTLEVYTLEELKPFIDTEEYVKVINDGKSYKNHTYFKELGCNSNKQYATNGKIYKIIKISKDKGIIFYALDYNGDHYLINKEGIEPSTKEEYDNQFKTKVTGTTAIDDDLRSSWLKDQENAILKGQRLHEKFYTDCNIFSKIERYLPILDPYGEMFNIKQSETFPQPIFLKEEEIIKTKQINQIKELKFLNIK